MRTPGTDAAGPSGLITEAATTARADTAESRHAIDTSAAAVDPARTLFAASNSVLPAADTPALTSPAAARPVGQPEDAAPDATSLPVDAAAPVRVADAPAASAARPADPVRRAAPDPAEVAPAAAIPESGRAAIVASVPPAATGERPNATRGVGSASRAVAMNWTELAPAAPATIAALQLTPDPLPGTTPQAADPGPVAPRARDTFRVGPPDAAAPRSPAAATLATTRTAATERTTSAPRSLSAGASANETLTPAALSQALQAAAPVATVPVTAQPAAATVLDVRLAPPIDSPLFAPALGSHVGALVKDGVSQARLHLNPEVMGPIAVQIRIEGTQAHVELVAEQPLTRQALEQAMPMLASALRESGLTLAGGGVFDQSRGSGQSPDQPRGGRPAPPEQQHHDGSAGAAPPPPPRTRRGLVDLYA